MSLLCVSITFHAIKGRHYHQTTIKDSHPKLSQNSTDNSQQKCNHLKHCQRKRCSQLNLQNSKNCGSGSKENLLKASTSTNSISSRDNPSLCDLCAKHLKDESKSQITLSEDEVREMYKRYKFYSIPTEMKTLPSLSNLVDFLTGLYNTISESMVR